MKLRKHPHLMEINAFVFLHRLSEKYGRPLTLATIPAQEWRAIAALGFDAVWLMGVWHRSPAARQCALRDHGLRRRYDHSLPGWTDEDVAGSPYAIYEYELDPFLGKKGELREVKAALNHAGLGLILDYVPNHLALDHPWTLSQPECFIEGTEKEARREQGSFFRTRHLRYLAHGRDPHFPPWGDTVQINYFSPLARKAAVETLLNIAAVADGVRCDMAMLGLAQISGNIWGRFLTHTPRPEKEFWDEVIPAVKSSHPDFLLMAEAYWDTEWKLQPMGFNFTYDKRLYDRLREGPTEEVRAHLSAKMDYQEKSVRFIENHDEARAAALLGREKSYAAAVVMATVPGLRFFYDGQLEGKRIKLPIQLGREPQEKEDPQAQAFYKRLLEYINQAPLHDGQWEMRSLAPAWKANASYTSLLSWSWSQKGEGRLVVVNYSASRSQGRVDLPFAWPREGLVDFRDALSGKTYPRDLKEIAEAGLYVDLEPWRAHLFECEI